MKSEVDGPQVFLFRTVKSSKHSSNETSAVYIGITTILIYFNAESFSHKGFENFLNY